MHGGVSQVASRPEPAEHRSRPASTFLGGPRGNWVHEHAYSNHFRGSTGNKPGAECIAYLDVQIWGNDSHAIQEHGRI